MHKIWNKQAQSGYKFEANPFFEHLLGRRAEILPQKVVFSGKTWRSKSLLSQLHLMAITMLYHMQAKLQRNLKCSLFFTNKFDKTHCASSFNYLWISLRIQMRQFRVLHYLHSPLQCTDPALCWFFPPYLSSCLRNEGTYLVIWLLQAEF